MLVVACVAAALLAAAVPETILAGDVEAYRERMKEMFAGRIPYFEFDFEHLPGAIIPMTAAWLLGGSQSLQAFALAFATFATITIAVTGILLVDLENELGTGLTVRWAASLVPLLPFLIFRNDSLPVLLVVMAFWAATRPQSGGGRGILPVWFGIATKLWPGSWAVIEWWRGRRALAIVTTALTIGALLALRTRPVLDIQRPIGVHTETLAGSILATVRHARGLPLHLHQTSALYIDAAWWAHLINVIPAVVLVVLALSILRRAFAWSQAWELFGVLTGCLMLASPLFSTQYMAWMTPFASTRRWPWFILILANALSLALIATWNAGLDGTAWWFWVALARNSIFVALIVVLVAGLLRGPSSRHVLTDPMR
jgi:hypothetical protein